MARSTLPTFVPKASLKSKSGEHLIPGLALVPLAGTTELNVFLTGGCGDPRRWIRGKLDGSGRFGNLAEAEHAALVQDSYLAKRADHYVVIGRGSLFD